MSCEKASYRCRCGRVVPVNSICSCIAFGEAKGLEDGLLQWVAFPS